jgi:hypothetical protein
MFDDICHLVNEYTLSQDLSIHTKLQCRKSFLRYMEGSHRTHLLRPTTRNVALYDGKIVTVPVFDMKEMLVSILTDKTLMSNTNFAEGYNVLTGDVDNNNPCNQKYREVHTGDAWLPTWDRYCTNPNRPTSYHASWFDCLSRQIPYEPTWNISLDTNHIHSNSLQTDIK